MTDSTNPTSRALLRAALASAGRRGKFTILAVALVVLMGVGPLAGSFEDAQSNEPASFLPDDAQSLAALEQAKRFPSGELLNAVIVFNRDGGLSSEDRRAIVALRRDLNSARPRGAERTPAPVVSPDGSSALLVTPLRADYRSQTVLDATREIRDRVEDLPPGLQAHVTGEAGFLTDSVAVFDGIDGKLLAAAALLVLVLLILIYRSPIFWLIPFAAVLFAETTSRGLGYLLAEAGVTINGQAGGILPVLVFGAGTDYALLLVARYREELRRHEDKHDAMRHAIRRAGPAIVGSAATVAAALLSLTLAKVNGTQGLGPIGALGIAVAMVTMLTVLPALLVLGGRRAFWPYVPRYRSETADEGRGRWRRLGERITRRPRRVWIASTILLALLALGLSQLQFGLTTGNGFRADVEAVAGQRLLKRAFAAGANAPTTAIVLQPADVDRVAAALQRTPGVASVRRAEQGSPGVKLDVVLDAAPYGRQALTVISRLREAAREAAGDDVLIGGPTAEEHDLREAAARDNRVVVPVALAVVFVILALLLRSLLAPVVLIATVVASFAAALGIGALAFEHLFDFPGTHPTLPLFAFVFLVALGVDYNIFLMARVREEAIDHGTRTGTLRGLAATGGVITSAGIVLAGTFSALGVLPLVFTTELAFVVAIGVLLDTFLVRSVLVPALAVDLGDRIWWPSALSRRSTPPAIRADQRPQPAAAGRRRA